MRLPHLSRSLSIPAVAYPKKRSPVLENTQIVTFGAGIYGELGTGGYSPSSTPVLVDRSLLGGISVHDQIVDVGCGWASSYALSRDGRVFMWGWPHDHRTSISCALMYQRSPQLLRWIQKQSFLGTLAFRSGITTPEMVPDLDDISQVSSGAGWSAAVTRHGQLFTFGDGFYGQLGHGLKKTYVHSPTRIVSEARGDAFLDSEVTQVSCGFTHTVILDRKGQVFSCGRLDSFAVGIGHVDDHFHPNILELCTRPQSLAKWHARLDRLGQDPMGPVSKIATGRNITAFLAEDGCLWTCGKNGTGALGIKSFESKAFPTRIDPGTFDGEEIVDVACGFYHMVALTESGRVFTWGAANHGQIGKSPQSGVFNSEAKGNISQDHRYIVYTHEPGQVLQGIVADSVHAGGFYTAIVTPEGLCVVMGGNSSDPDAYLPKLPFTDRRVRKIGFGLSHGVALCDEAHHSNVRFRSDAEAITEDVKRKLFGQTICGAFDHFTMN